MGDPACWLGRTCLSCGRMLELTDFDSCPGCGSTLEPRDESATILRTPGPGMAAPEHSSDAPDSR